jgi:hypothetical protein
MNSANIPECLILESIVVSKPELEKPPEKILASHSGSNIEDCCELIVYIFLFLVCLSLILALPICEIIIHYMKINVRQMMLLVYQHIYLYLELLE